MTKKILVLFYTQSGQLGDILSSITGALVKAGHKVDFLRVYPEQEYTFPWTSERFFAVMPDCANNKSIALKPFTLQENKYDLVLLGYQPWFLSPSLPTNAILSDPSIKTLLKNTPVITITGARNMWIGALERIKRTLKELDTKHVGNIVLVDRTQNHISVVTILYWMLSGKKEKFLGIFPKPGVSDQDIQAASTHGSIIEKFLKKGEWKGLQNELFENKAVVISYNLMYTELKAARIFSIWANIINKRKNKTAWLVVFKYYLIIALFIAAPIILTLHTLLVRPFIQGRIKKQLHYYSGVNYN